MSLAPVELIACPACGDAWPPADMWAVAGPDGPVSLCSSCLRMADEGIPDEEMVPVSLVRKLHWAQLLAAALAGAAAAVWVSLVVIL